MIVKQKVIGIVVSVALAAVGTALLVAYVQSAKDDASKGGDKTKVLVVKSAIAKGTSVSDLAGKVADESVPNGVVAQGALSSLGSIADQVALVDLLPGEQLVSSRFGAAAKLNNVGVPPGMLQVTVAVDATRGIAGQVRAGDTVAVLASFEDPDVTHIIEQKVLVTNVRDDAGTSVKTSLQDATPPGGLKVTFALDAPSVERVVFGAEFGKLWLAWEPVDASEAGTAVQTRESVLG